MKVLVIGSGLAGFISGISAIKSGNQVTILEKMNTFGGNSIKAFSGIAFVNSRLQKSLGIVDDKFLYDILVSSNKDYVFELIERLIEYSPRVEELLYEIGIVFDKLIKCE